jgi:antibiotic biosynthesis monooxygenase (ABM) superfamily enzyme
MSNPTQGAVTVLVTRRVKPGHDVAFEQAMGGMLTTARGFAGHLGGQVVCPTDQAGAGVASTDLYHVVFAFDNADHLAAWQGSPERAAILASVAEHTVGASEMRQVSGLAHWFTEPKGAPQAPPPRWKVAVVTWLGIFPTVLVLFLTVAITALVVLLMTWVVAPQLTRWLRGWLHSSPAGALQ